MNESVTVACPYCGKIISTVMKKYVEVAYCHKCNRHFAVNIVITKTTVGLKIEGEENKESR